MRTQRLRGALLLCAAVVMAGLCTTSARGQSGDDDRPPVTRPPKLVQPYRLAMDFNHFYDYDDLTRTLQRVADEYPEFTDLRSIGRSRQGRDLWMMRVTDESVGDPDLKPAMYVDGNIHGNEIQATEVCLYVIYSLINRADRDEFVADLLRTRTFYIVPSVNPDSRARFFAEANTPHSPRQNVRPYDNDMDGRLDEDGPDDLNGDGVITMMRKRDPYGSFRTGEDPRVWRSREPDEPGQWTLYWWEGLDNDGDGQINEDAVGGVDMNRNFPADWQPWSTQWGAGPYPTSEPEIRAIVEFAFSRPNIAALQSFHNSGNMILYAFGARPNSAMPSRDRQIYEAMAERGQEILTEYTAGGIFDDLYRVYGSTVDFGYVHQGAISFTNELWGWVIDYDGDGSISAAERMRWSDEQLHGEAFVEWTPFDHPELGEIEIGGWTQFHSRVPPVRYLEELCRLNADFVLFHASATPRLEITRTEVTSLGDGLVALDVFVANTGIMDTSPELAVDLGIARSVIAEVQLPSSVTALEGGRRDRERSTRTITYDPVDRRRPTPERLEIGQIRGGSEIAVRWILRADGGWAQVSFSSEKAGGVTGERIELTPSSD